MSFSTATLSVKRSMLASGVTSSKETSSKRSVSLVSIRFSVSALSSFDVLSLSPWMRASNKASTSSKLELSTPLESIISVELVPAAITAVAAAAPTPASVVSIFLSSLIVSATSCSSSNTSIKSSSSFMPTVSAMKDSALATLAVSGLITSALAATSSLTSASTGACLAAISSLTFSYVAFTSLVAIIC